MRVFTGVRDLWPCVSNSHAQSLFVSSICGSGRDFWKTSDFARVSPTAVGYFRSPTVSFICEIAAQVEILLQQILSFTVCCVHNCYEHSFEYSFNEVAQLSLFFANDLLLSFIFHPEATAGIINRAKTNHTINTILGRTITYFQPKGGIPYLNASHNSLYLNFQTELP